MPRRAKGRVATTRPKKGRRIANTSLARASGKAAGKRPAKVANKRFERKGKRKGTGRAAAPARGAKRTPDRLASRAVLRTKGKTTVPAAFKANARPKAKNGPRERPKRIARPRAPKVKPVVTTVVRPVSTPFVPPVGSPDVRPIIRTIASARPPEDPVAPAHQPFRGPAIAPAGRLAKEPPPSPAMPTRALGRHAQAVSILGLGSGHLAKASQAEALRTVREALDKGVTLIETGPRYGDGRVERWIGLALYGAARAGAMICVQQDAPMRDYKTAMAGLDDSLSRLKTDVVDIWMIPEVIYDNDPEWIYAHGGLDAALEAREQGKVRFIGFSGHKSPHILLKLLGRGHDWDVVGLPLNPLDAHFRSFERQALPELVRRGVAVIGMKPFGGGTLSQSRLVKPDDVLRYALSLPVSSVIVGAESRAILRKSLSVARDGRLLHAGDMDAIRTKTRIVAGDGRFERYKTTTDADSSPGLVAHGYLASGRRTRR